MSVGIAIVGMACLYPDAKSPRELLENALAKRRAFRRMPAERLRLADYYSADKSTPDATYATEAAVITDYEFDRVGYRVAGSAYRATDLTHWLALDIAAQALADAGFPGGEGLPREGTGVLVGNTLTGEFSRAAVMRLRWPYVRRVTEAALARSGASPEERAQVLGEMEALYKAPFAPVGEDTLAGGLANVIAGRICNHFDLKGGGYTLDGACSSSLLAVAQGCTALATGDLDAVLVGGVDLSLDPFELIGFAKTGALAPEEMRVFDTRSGGFWPGEGCGFAVLMRHEDAVARGLKIYATIRGWGTSSDGAGGLTRPEADGQALAMRRAYKKAGYGIESVGLFEAHGTGTAVGDAVELRALNAERAGARGRAAVSSVKGNIGHTKAAAGMAGLIKAAMAVHAGVLPPTTGMENPHPESVRDGSSLSLLRVGQTWPEGQPKRAGVSGFGFGGINVHVALEGTGEAVVEEHLFRSGQDAELFCLSGSRDELRAQVERLIGTAAWISRAEMADLAAQLAASASGGAVRAAVVAAKPAEFEAGLRQLLTWLEEGVTRRVDAQAGLFLGEGAAAPRIAYLFPGQGAPVYQSGGALGDRFAAVGAIWDGWVLPEGTDTAVAQPAITLGSLAGVKALALAGVEASLAVGHSLGELGALQWAGACDAEAVVKLAEVRGRAMADLPGPTGAMASIAAGPAELHELMAGLEVSVACYNGPRQTVIAGTEAAVVKVVAAAKARGYQAVRLPVSHAFHSPLVAESAVALLRYCQEQSFAELQRPVVSTVTGSTLSAGFNGIPQLLATQVEAPVRFTEALARALTETDLFIEVGPGRILTGLAAEQGSVPAIALDAGGTSLGGFLRAVGAAWALGAPTVKPAALFADRFTRPFEPDRRPSFFVNPCEMAPVSDTSAVAPVVAADTEVSVVEASSADEVLAVFRELVAEKTEFPESAIAEETRLLEDLHLSSIAVGQLVAELARKLNVAAPAAPNEYAGSTVGEAARAFHDAMVAGGGAAVLPVEATPGVGAWVRPFVTAWVSRPLKARRSAAIGGRWQVVGSLPGLSLEGVEGNGVLLCLPPNPGENEVPLLMAGVKALLEQEGANRFVLVQHGEGGAALARTIHQELPGMTTVVVDVPVGHPQAAAWVAAEAQAAKGYVEVRYTAEGVRQAPVLKLLEDGEAAAGFGPSDVVLVTGGGKGIGAEIALDQARRTGAALILLGRAKPEQDAELAANLERMAAAGIRYQYVMADITDRAATAGALAEAQAKLGAVTALLHAAGANTPQPLAKLTEESFRRTVAVKVRGLENALAAVDPAKLRLLVTFGSVIARAGMRGEADYAVANDWLRLATERYQAEHPHCRCLAMEWSVWSGVGMGERLGTVDALTRVGITPIPLDGGVAMFDRLIGQQVSAVTVVLTGRLGGAPTVAWESRDLPLLRFLEQPLIHYPGVELVTESGLSAEHDPYLADHQFQGELLFPAVMGLEAMAQAVQALTGEAPVVMERVEFARPVVVPAGRSAAIRTAALVRGPGCVEVALRTEATGYQADHFRAVCRTGVVLAEGEPVEAPRVTLPLNPATDLYGGLLFQKGRFQRVAGYRVLMAREAVAEIGPAAKGVSWFGGFLPQAVLLEDPGARDAALHAVQVCVPDSTVLPVSVERITFHGKRRAGEAVVLFAKERSHEGDRFLYDLEVRSLGGQLLERWQGLVLHRVRQGAVTTPWVEPLLGPYLERRARQLMPGWQGTVAVETGGGERRERSTRAMQRSVGRRVAVTRRPDGKPVVDGLAVSAAHAGSLALGVAAPDVAGCDLEAVAERPEAIWRDLLGAERLSLAHLVAQESGETLDVAATRVWAAVESLTKAGVLPTSTLVLRKACADGWVVFATSGCTIVTGHVLVRDGRQLVAAVLGRDSGK